MACGGSGSKADANWLGSQKKSPLMPRTAQYGPTARKPARHKMHFSMASGVGRRRANVDDGTMCIVSKYNFSVGPQRILGQEI